MIHNDLVDRLLEALKERERVAGQIYSISTEDLRTMLDEHPGVSAKLEGLDPEVLAWAITDAIGELGILELVRSAIFQTIEIAASGGPQERDPGEPLDGDANSALTSAGFGTDEDYGRFGPDVGGCRQ